MLRTHTRFSSASHPQLPGLQANRSQPFASPHMPCGLKKGKNISLKPWQCLKTSVKIVSLDSLVCTGRNDLRKNDPCREGHLSLPASSPTIEPMAACKQMSGEQMNRATRNTPPVQGLSQPYTCPPRQGWLVAAAKSTKSRSVEYGLIMQAPSLG